MQQLDRRLQTVFSMVRTGKIVADVGTDHGYLSAALLEQKKCPKVYACDINEGPLKSAVGTLSAFEPSTWRAILSDGLEQVPADAEDLVIAGMGGETIAAILERAPWTADEGYTLILQPMSAQPAVNPYARPQAPAPIVNPYAAPAAQESAQTAARPAANPYARPIAPPVQPAQPAQAAQPAPGAEPAPRRTRMQRYHDASNGANTDA